VGCGSARTTLDFYRNKRVCLFSHPSPLVQDQKLLYKFKIVYKLVKPPTWLASCHLNIVSNKISSRMLDCSENQQAGRPFIKKLLFFSRGNFGENSGHRCPKVRCAANIISFSVRFGQRVTFGSVTVQITRPSLFLPC
jgi:hypothetical protein